MIKKYFQNNLFSFLLVVTFVSLFVLTIGLAWTEPNAAPPGGNVSAPLNVGPVPQIKRGGLILNTGGAEIGLIVAQGNVGIGTTAPGGKLGILSGWGNWIRFDDSVSGNRYMFHNPSDGSRFEIGVYDASEETNRWGVFVIRPSGNVGIGTTTPAQKLTVAGNIDVTGNRIVNLANPIDNKDAATKEYVDAQAGGGFAFPSGILQPFADPNTSTRPGWTYTGFFETREGDVWITRKSMSTPRSGLAAAVVGNRIYAIGGYNGSYLSTNEEYDPSTDTWTTRKSMSTPRSGLAAAVVNNTIYAIGGYNEMYSNNPMRGYFITNEAYNPSNDSWVNKASMKIPRAYLAAAVVNDKIYAIGGFNTTTGYLSINEEYNPFANDGFGRWETKAPMSTPRSGLAAAVVNNKIYVIGGYGPTASNLFADFLSTNEVYDPANDTWRTRDSMPTARTDLAAAVVNNKIYAIGGYNGRYLSTNEVYDPANNSWETRRSMTTARSGLAAAVVNNIIYAIGGRSGSSILSTNEAYPILNLYWFKKQ
jgi:N-acetylneuraminic acid mutarotase